MLGVSLYLHIRFYFAHGNVIFDILNKMQQNTKNSIYAESLKHFVFVFVCVFVFDFVCDIAR